MKKVFLLLYFVLGIIVLKAETITVTNTNDNGPGSLRQAIIDVTDGGTISIPFAGPIILDSELPIIAKSLIIKGNGGGTFISGNGHRVFTVQINSGLVFFNNLIISNAVSYNGAAAGLYAITANSGQVALERCTFYNCITTGSEAYGGAIATGAELFMTNCTLYGNMAETGGGAIAAFSNTSVNINNCTIYKNNTLNLAGSGGIDITENSMVWIQNSILAGNTASLATHRDVLTTNGGTLMSVGNNLSNTAPFFGPGDLTNRDLTNEIKLSDIVQHPSGMMVCELLDGSIAIDRANGPAAPLQDQCFRSRIVNADIGSYEKQAFKISGNTGVGNVLLSYTAGTPKTIVTEVTGNYSIYVPLGWSGTVTPSRSNYVFTPESKNYLGLAAYIAGENYIAKIVQTISFNELEAKTYGDLSFTLSASGGASGNPVVFSSSDPTVATCTGINGSTITILKAGDCQIHADQAGDDTYAAATRISRDLQINKKPIIITVNGSQSKVYGETDPGLTYSINTALVGSDVLSGSLERVSGENVGSYAINQGTLSGGDNYDITSFGGNTFAVTAKPIPVTVNTSQSKVYGSSDPVFSYTVNPALKTDDSFTGVLTRTAGEDVGNYAIGTGTLSAGSNYNMSFVSNDFAITAQPITVTANSGQNKIYGDADPVFAYTVSPSLKSGDAFTGALSRVSGENVGSYAIEPGTLSAGSNYAITFVSSNFTVNIKSITVTAKSNQSKLYGDADPALTYDVSPALKSGDAFTGALTRVAGENVGSYAINQGTLDAGSNYNITFESKDFAISAKPITVTANTGQSKVYNTSDPVFSYTVNPALKTGDSFTGALTRAAGENAGNYAIGLGTLSAGSNYNINFVSSNFTINAKPITVTASASHSKVYGEADPVFIYSVSPELKTGDVFTGALTRVTGENIGTYAINQGTLSAGGNYNITYVGSNFSISAKPITVTTLAGFYKIYGEADPAFLYMVSPDLKSGDAFSGALSRETGENVGAYAYTLGTLTAGSNYSITFNGTDFFISFKNITVTAKSNQSKVYGDADPALTYDVSPALKSGDAFTGVLTRVAGENVGSYAINQGTLDAGSNYNITFESKDFAISAKPITVTANTSQSKVYSTSDPVFSYTVNPALKTGDSFTGTLTRATGENAGNYAIGLGTLSAGSNYNINFLSNNFSITAKPITVTASASHSKVYGEADPVFTYSVSPALKTGDAFTGALTRATGENVGTYAINQGTLSAGGNYSITYVGSNFSISSKPITVTTLAGFYKVYGEADPAFLYMVSPDLKSGDEFSGALSRETGENFGAYAYTLGTLTAGSNYSITFNGSHFSISPKPITVTANANQSKVYGDVDPSLSYSVNPSLKNGDSFSGELTRATGENAGNYAINQGSLNAGSNYYLTFVGNNFQIKPKALTVTGASVESKVYDKSDVATISGAVLSGKIGADDVTLTNAATGVFDNPNVGTGKLVTTSMGIAGSSIGNYTFIQPVLTGNISAKVITVLANTNQRKVYGEADPDLTYTVSPSLLDGDVFTGKMERASGENVGKYSINKGTLNASDNYSITFEGSDFNITPKPVTINPTAANKTYEGTTTAQVSGTLSGVVNGDNVLLSITNGIFSDKKAAAGKTVTANVALSGADAINYTIDNSISTTANIEKANLTIDISAQNKTYDGNTNANVTSSITNGLVAGDAVSAVVANGRFDNKNAGTGRTVTADISISGADAGNYTCNSTATTKADITKASLSGVITASPDLSSYNGGSAVTFTVSLSEPVDVAQGLFYFNLTGAGLTTRSEMTSSNRSVWTYPWTAPLTGNGTINVEPVLQDLEGNYNLTVSGKTSVVLVNNPNGISSVKSGTTLSVYPTENRGRFKISIANEESGIVTVKILNLQGATIEEFQFKKIYGLSTFDVNLQNPVVGLYLVETTMDGFRNVQRIVVY